MARIAVRSLWFEPSALQPPVRVWRDWALVAAFVSLSVLEAVLRTDAEWPALGAITAVMLAFTLLWRRTRPLAMLTLAFGLTLLVEATALAAGARGSVAFVSMAYLLVLVYALFRWGSGRAALVGSVIAVAADVSISMLDGATLGDTFFGVLVLAVPAVLGASVRLRAITRLRELDHVRLDEREQLARDLHDSVAHHVSAMVVRAQAGRVVAPSQPDAALGALEIIEAEGSRTLTELRTMVGVLRGRHDADLAPQQGARDIEGLARATSGTEPPVAVHLTGDLDDLSPTVGAASYRIAQEAVTNATRHARHATGIVVTVTGERDQVRLSISDDGDAVPPGRRRDGFGIVGMTERAALLGGTLRAGPGADHGWTVEATLPRRGPA